MIVLFVVCQGFKCVCGYIAILISAVYIRLNVYFRLEVVLVANVRFESVVQSKVIVSVILCKYIIYDDRYEQTRGDTRKKISSFLSGRGADLSDENF